MLTIFSELLEGVVDDVLVDVDAGVVFPWGMIVISSDILSEAILEAELELAPDAAEERPALSPTFLLPPLHKKDKVNVWKQNVWLPYLSENQTFESPSFWHFRNSLDRFWGLKIIIYIKQSRIALKCPKTGHFWVLENWKKGPVFGHRLYFYNWFVLIEGKRHFRGETI